MPSKTLVPCRMDFERKNLPQFRADTHTLLNVSWSYASANEDWEASLNRWNPGYEHCATYITLGRNIAGGAEPGLPVTVFGEPLLHYVTVIFMSSCCHRKTYILPYIYHAIDQLSRVLTHARSTV